jgi:hypothetical protein
MNKMNLNDGWHAHSIDETLKIIDVDADGLDASEVIERRTQYGTNT